MLPRAVINGTKSGWRGKNDGASCKRLRIEKALEDDKEVNDAMCDNQSADSLLCKRPILCDLAPALPYQDGASHVRSDRSKFVMGGLYDPSYLL